MIKGTKLFFDFSGKYPYDQKLTDLAKELGEHGKMQQLIDEIDVGYYVMVAFVLI